MTAPFPTYRRHKPSDQAVVTLNGRDFYLGPWKSQASRTEFDRLIAEWLANGRRRSSAARFRRGFSSSLDGAPFLLPTDNTMLRRSLS